jgi:hypothetical protein
MCPEKVGQHCGNPRVLAPAREMPHGPKSSHANWGLCQQKEYLDFARQAARGRSRDNGGGRSRLGGGLGAAKKKVAPALLVRPARTHGFVSYFLISPLASNCLT